MDANVVLAGLCVICMLCIAFLLFIGYRYRKSAASVDDVVDMDVVEVEPEAEEVETFLGEDEMIGDVNVYASQADLNDPMGHLDVSGAAERVEVVGEYMDVSSGLVDSEVDDIHEREFIEDDYDFASEPQADVEDIVYDEVTDTDDVFDYIGESDDEEIIDSNDDVASEDDFVASVTPPVAPPVPEAPIVEDEPLEVMSMADFGNNSVAPHEDVFPGYAPEPVSAEVIEEFVETTPRPTARLGSVEAHRIRLELANHAPVKPIREKNVKGDEDSLMAMIESGRVTIG